MAFGSYIGDGSPSTTSSTPSRGHVAKLARVRAGFDRESAHLKLTPSQQRFIDTFFSGHNVCLTGSAGTGKSFIIKHLHDTLSSMSVSIGRTALTGIAAFSIGGQTIHSWAGLGLADEDVQSLIAHMRKNRRAQDRIRAAEILFVDEISMAKGDLLDKLDVVLKYWRRNNAPWGGLQVVASGDPLQLPPVFKGDANPQFFFQCRAWHEGAFKVVVLKEPVRQEDGGTLLKVLNDIRVGNVESLHLLDDRIDARVGTDEIEPVRLFCRNVDVTKYNEDRLAKLPSEPRTYYSKDTGSPHQIESFERNCSAPGRLTLKVGAQVMLVTNLDQDNGLVNGSVGVVGAFGQNGVTVRFKNGKSAIVDRNEWQVKEQEAGLDGKIRYKVVATRSQIPLRLCWGMTVHKSQGQTLDCVVVDLKEAFGDHIIYVGLSRVRDLQSLSLVSPITPSMIRVNLDCLKFYQEAEKAIS